MLFHVALLAFALLVNSREITHNDANNNADALSIKDSNAEQKQDEKKQDAEKQDEEKQDEQKQDGQKKQQQAPVNGTASDLISAISTGVATTPVATKGVEKDIKLKSEGNIVGGKAVFIPVASGCKQSSPNVVISEGGIGKFKITGEVGYYKLCFQAPGKTDSVEQVSQGPDLTLELVAPTTTEPNVITGIYPAKITVNVRTMIDFEGAGPGDKATWVNAATNDCSAVSPDKDVGAGHNTFLISSSGTYQLCYRVYGATDSVVQGNVSLIVRPPGVSQDMTERWNKFIKKDGSVDCSTLNWIPACTMSNKTVCEKSYAIDSAVGYTCSWDDSVFPPFCTVDLTTTDAAKICRELTCGDHEDGTPKCWS